MMLRARKLICGFITSLVLLAICSYAAEDIFEDPCCTIHLKHASEQGAVESIANVIFDSDSVVPIEDSTLSILGSEPIVAQLFCDLRHQIIDKLRKDALLEKGEFISRLKVFFKPDELLEINRVVSSNLFKKYYQAYRLALLNTIRSKIEHAKAGMLHENGEIELMPLLEQQFLSILDLDWVFRTNPQFKPIATEVKSELIAYLRESLTITQVENLVDMLKTPLMQAFICTFSADLNRLGQLAENEKLDIILNSNNYR